MLDAYQRKPPIPALLGESNYEGENNQEDSPPTTDLTLRRQMLWALTSGAAGDFMGSHDWEFHPGWEKRLNTASVSQLQRLHAYVATLPWWRLVPDTGDDLPSARTISLDPAAVPARTKATWVDPTSGAERPADLSAAMTTPGKNAGGDGDWLLVLRS